MKVMKGSIWTTSQRKSL